MIINAQIHEIAISDHSPVPIEIQDVRPIANYIAWRFHSQLTQHDDLKIFLIDEWREYITLNAGHMTDPVLFWETGKAVIRGRIIAYTSQQKKRLNNT